MEINRQGLTLRLMVHPILVVQRDAQGQLQSVQPRRPGTGQDPTLRESWMHVEIDRLVDESQRQELLDGLRRVLGDVRIAVADWQAMLANLRQASAELESPPASLPADAVSECRAFLQWLAANHFTLLGYRRHDLVNEQGEDALRLVPGSGLGVLRESAQSVSASFAAVPAPARALARAPMPLLLVTRSNSRSTVHRPGYTDYVGVKRYNAAGEVIGEHRFVGLFTSTAYSEPVTDIPLLRGKVEAVRERAALPAGGHLSKAFDHILATYPRDDLFQIGEDDLHHIALGILSASERQRLRLFLWRDPFDRFVSCLIYVPREAFSTALRIKFQNILMAAFSGERADFEVALGNTLLARVHITIRTRAGKLSTYDARAIEAELAHTARRWDDVLREALVDEVGEARGMELFKQWGACFPQVYREVFSARAAVPDVLKLDSMSAEQPLALALYRPLGGARDVLGFKVYSRGAKVVLSDSLPMLERMGVRVLGEDNFRIGSPDDAGGFVSLHDFKLEGITAPSPKTDTSGFTPRNSIV
jgi:glutamate dehydrogenase